MCELHSATNMFLAKLVELKWKPDITIYNIYIHLQCVSPIQLHVMQYQPKKGNVIDKQINQRQNDRCNPSLRSMLQTRLNCIVFEVR